MYCGKCGKEITDVDLPCPNCGDKTIRYANPQIDREPVYPKAKRKKSVLFESGARKNRSVLILIVIIAAIALFYNSTDGSQSPEDAVEKLTEAYQKFNVNTLIEFSTYNETCQKKLGNVQYNVAELKNQLEREYKSRVKSDEKKVYSIIDTYTLSGEELEETKEKLKLFFNNVENIEEIKVVKTKEVVDNKEIEREYYCLKVDGRWYVSIELLGSDFLV
jgi:hypothetical protein